jgi:hypothetical protein
MWGNVCIINEKYDETKSTRFEDIDAQAVQDTIAQVALMWQKMMTTLMSNWRSQRPS